MDLDLIEDWQGWRLRGRWLVSPDGDRVQAHRLRAWLYFEQLRQRIAVSREAARRRGLSVELMQSGVAKKVRALIEASP